MDGVLEMIHVPVSRAASHCRLCITALMMNVPVRNPTNVLLILIIVSRHSSPPMFPPGASKLLLSVCLRLGLDIGGESSLRPPASPLLPSFPFSSLLLFDLLKPLSAASLLPHTSRMQDLCLCGCVCVLSRVCKSCNGANLIPPRLCFFPPLPCVCSLAWRGAHSHVRVIAGRRHG